MNLYKLYTVIFKIYEHKCFIVISIISLVIYVLNMNDLYLYFVLLNKVTYILNIFLVFNINIISLIYLLILKCFNFNEIKINMENSLNNFYLIFFLLIAIFFNVC